MLDMIRSFSLKSASENTKARPTGARRSFVSSRTAVMLVILVTAVMLLALPLREYLRQQGEIEAAAELAGHRQVKVDELQQRVDLWQDEDYVRSQARKRLHFLLPGEVGYIVLDSGVEDSNDPGAIIAKAPKQGPWYAELWESVGAADRNTAPVAPPRLFPNSPR